MTILIIAEIAGNHSSDLGSYNRLRLSARESRRVPEHDPGSRRLAVYGAHPAFRYLLSAVLTGRILTKSVFICIILKPCKLEVLIVAAAVGRGVLLAQ